jgi:hypothetical protein
MIRGCAKVWENVRNAECYNAEAIRPLSNPLVKSVLSMLPTLMD